jgi:hypothetical protein
MPTIQAVIHDDMSGMNIEYGVGDIIPVTSSLYRVVHEPGEEGQQFQTFCAGENFPACPRCGKNVRYLLPRRILGSLKLTSADPNLTQHQSTGD